MYCVNVDKTFVIIQRPYGYLLASTSFYCITRVTVGSLTSTSYVPSIKI